MTQYQVISTEILIGELKMYIDGKMRPPNVIEEHLAGLTDDQVLECLVIIRDKFFYRDHLTNTKDRRDKAISLIAGLQGPKPQPALRQARKLLIGACTGDRSEDAKMFLEVA